MAASLLAYEVADLCLGKPPLKSLSVSATVADALSAVKNSENNCISIWSCDHYSKIKRIGVNQEECVCIGKICMVDIICYLCREENLSSPSLALNSPVSTLLSKVTGLVRHVDASSSIVEAIDLIVQGAQNLVVPIKTSITTSSKRKLSQKSTIVPTIHNGREFCWLTQEDVVRFLLNSIGMFSPIASLSVEKLGIIDTNVLAIQYQSAASDAVDVITEALENQTSVAVVDSDGSLIGEISPFTLSYCDESVAAAITTLSAGDLMAYIDCGGPPEEITGVVKSRLKERDLNEMLEELMIDSSSNAFTSSSSSSSDDELHSPTTTLSSRSRRHSRSSSYSARMVRRAEAIVCHRRSSLIAVMIQALAHRVNYVWVIEEDGTVVGMVTFVSILEVFRCTFSP